ncbi:MAG: hypothetical protein AAGN35_18080 [Bacteroidota bacterium]
MDSTRWEALTLKELPRLVAAKRQVHQAVQIVSAAGRHLLPHHPWDIFGNLEWLASTRMWLGWSIPGRFECRVGLRPADLSLHLCTPRGDSFAQLSLDGTTYSAGFAWLRTELKALGIDPEPIDPELPYEIPAYPQADGAPFALGDPEAFVEFARTFHNAQVILNYVASRYQLWQSVRTWPHHFDLSSRRRLAKGDDFWHLGVGYAPGDDYNCAEPYFHLTCYPSDDVNRTALPALTGDLQWHTEGWLGILLPWSKVVAESTGPAQFALVTDGLERGMKALIEVKG